MFASIATITLTSKIKRENSLRQKKFLPWDKIERMALIITKEGGMNKSSLDKFLDSTKKYVEVFYVETSSKEASYGDWKCFSKKDISLLSLPKKHIEAELVTKRFDIVINTCGDTDLFSASLCASLPAQLKCWNSSRFNLADLVIKKSQPFELISYLHDIVKYLKMIRA